MCWVLFPGLLSVLILRGDLRGLGDEGLCSRTELPSRRPRRKGQLEGPLELLSVGATPSLLGRKGQEHGRRWLVEGREGPWHPDSHDDPGAQGLTGSGKGIWLMVSQDAGPGWQSRATLPMGRGRYHLWPVKLPRRLGTNCAQEW